MVEIMKASPQNRFLQCSIDAQQSAIQQQWRLFPEGWNCLDLQPSFAAAQGLSLMTMNLRRILERGRPFHSHACWCAQGFHITRPHFLEQISEVETVSGWLDINEWKGSTEAIQRGAKLIHRSDEEIAMVMEELYDIVDSIADLTVEDVKRHLSNRC